MSRTTRKRANKSHSVVGMLGNIHGQKVRKRTLLATMQLSQLVTHYHDVGERVRAAMPPPGAEQTTNYLQLSAQLQEDLQDLSKTKQAIRELSAELGTNWLGKHLGFDPSEMEDASPEDQLRIIGEALDGQHRTGGHRG